MTETAQQIVEYQQGPTPTQPLTVLPMTLVQRAFDAGNLELVERALVLQERWEAAQARKAFDAAMAAVRGELPAIVKNRSVSSQDGGKNPPGPKANIAMRIWPALPRRLTRYWPSTA